MTMTPTQRSAVASEVSNMFVKVLILLYKQTERTTSTLPKIVVIINTIKNKATKMSPRPRQRSGDSGVTVLLLSDLGIMVEVEGRLWILESTVVDLL